MPNGIHKDQAKVLSDRLAEFELKHGQLPGLAPAGWKETLVAQIVSSLRRIDYVHEIARRPISAARCDPHSNLFDPIRGAAYLGRRGESDEAVWMTFIATHFGKHRIDGWRLAANVMGSFRQGPIWTARQFESEKHGFHRMLINNRARLRDGQQSGRFSNHRQYQSKQPDGIFETFDTFHSWMRSEGNFSNMLQKIHLSRGQKPTEGFDYMFQTLDAVSGFGRLGKFDFLTMLGKLGIAPIEAGSVYLVGATGPLSGARLLFYGDRDCRVTARRLEPNVDKLDDYLLVGKQVIEDSLCNWQKSPDSYEYFRG